MANAERRQDAQRSAASKPAYQTEAERAGVASPGFRAPAPAPAPHRPAPPAEPPQPPHWAQTECPQSQGPAPQSGPRSALLRVGWQGWQGGVCVCVCVCERMHGGLLASGGTGATLLVDLQAGRAQHRTSARRLPTACNCLPASHCCAASSAAAEHPHAPQPAASGWSGWRQSAHPWRSRQQRPARQLRRQQYLLHPQSRSCRQGERRPAHWSGKGRGRRRVRQGRLAHSSALRQIVLVQCARLQASTAAQCTQRRAGRVHARHCRAGQQRSGDPHAAEAVGQQHLVNHMDHCIETVWLVGWKDKGSVRGEERARLRSAKPASPACGACCIYTYPCRRPPGPSPR